MHQHAICSIKRNPMAYNKVVSALQAHELLGPTVKPVDNAPLSAQTTPKHSAVMLFHTSTVPYDSRT